MRPLTLIPIAGVPRDDVTSLGDDLARAGFDVSVRHQRPVSAGSYDRTRRQYRAEALVDLAETLEIIGDRESAGPPLREALALFEQKGDLVTARRVRERMAGSRP